MHDPTPAPGMEYGKATVLKASKTEEVSDSLFMVSSLTVVFDIFLLQLYFLSLSIQMNPKVQK